MFINHYHQQYKTSPALDVYGAIANFTLTPYGCVVWYMYIRVTFKKHLPIRAMLVWRTRQLQYCWRSKDSETRRTMQWRVPLNYILAVSRVGQMQRLLPEKHRSNIPI